MNEVITYAVKLVFAVAGVLITYCLVPWLKEKRLYDICRQFVRAAEKLAANVTLDKKQYVIDCLTNKGIKVTPAVDALIEAAVEELDIAIGKAGKEKVSADNADDGCGMTD